MEHAVVQTDVDRYIIVEYLAEGGMGAIFLGKKVGMGGFEKEVVLKQLLPEFTSQPEFIDLFLREAKLSAALDHANIVHTIDLVAAGNDYFIVMEYVRGGDLRAILRRIKQRGHRVEPAAAIYIAREILSALAYAHEKKGNDGQPLKLIHRDVSPSNIMISGAGEVKLADFGIAKASTHKSVFYRVKGKVGYMSPEQAYGQPPLDHRSDLYSLAVCLHEMLSGERLFVADLLSTPDQIYGQPIAKLESEPGVPPGMDQVMARALAFNPDDRYQSAIEFHDALVQLAYESAMLYSAPDLSGHLHRVCGPDASHWNKEHVDDAPAEHGRGTEVLPEDRSQFSGVALTSIFTTQGGGQPGRQSGAGSPDDSRSLAFQPTVLKLDSRDRDRNQPQPSFDVSDLRRGDLLAGPPGERLKGERPRSDWPADPSPPQTDWPGDDQEPTVALRDPKRLIDELDGARRSAAPDLAQAAVSDDDSLDEATRHLLPNKRPGEASRRPVEASKRTGEAGKPSKRPGEDGDPTVELRMHLSDADVPLASPGRSRSRSELPGWAVPSVVGDSSLSVRQVQAGQPVKNRWLMLAAIVLLIISGAAIVIIVGLTGPNLDDRSAVPGGRPAIARKRDSGQGSDLASSGAAPDARLRLDSGSAAPSTAASKAVAGILKVESTPPRARVHLDGVLQCETPCTIEELEQKRIYLLSVRKKDHVSWSALVDLSRCKARSVSAFLSEEPDPRTVGYLLVRSTTPAEVLVDRKEIGRVSSEGRIPLPPGQYEISLRHPRRKAHPKRIVNITAGQATSLKLRL